MTDFGAYQLSAAKTANYPQAGTGDMSAVACVALGLASAAGEVAGEVKRVLRDDAGALTQARIITILGNLGDVLWYVSQLASELGEPLEHVAEANLAKPAALRGWR